MPLRGDVDNYARGGRIGEMEARRMSAAVLRRLPDVPTFLADGYTTETRPPVRTIQDLWKRQGDEQGNPVAYFNGRRTTLINFANMAASGAFEVRLIPSGYSPEFSSTPARREPQGSERSSTL